MQDIQTALTEKQGRVKIWFAGGQIVKAEDVPEPKRERAKIWFEGGQVVKVEKIA